MRAATPPETIDFHTDQKNAKAAIKKEIQDFAEDRFNTYQKSRKLKDLQPLYNVGIYLCELSPNGSDTQRRSLLNTEGHHLVKMYEKFNGKLEFTKILVYPER